MLSKTAKHLPEEEKIMTLLNFLSLMYSSTYAMFQTRLLTSEDEYKWYWHQMILFSWNNKYNKYNEYNNTDTFTYFFLAMHINLICACWHLEAMKGLSSLTSCRLLILSRLPSSLIWAQLTLLVPALGIRPPLPQNGAPIHRVRAHPLTGIRNTPIVKTLNPLAVGMLLED